MITFLSRMLGGFVVIGGIEVLHVFAHTVFKEQRPYRACVSPLNFERFIILFLLITFLCAVMTASGGKVDTILPSYEVTSRGIKMFEKEERKRKSEKKCPKNEECCWFGIVKPL